MKINTHLTESSQTIGVNFGNNSKAQTLGVNFGTVTTRTELEKDYNKLYNRPSINGIELLGSLTTEDLGLGRVYYNTTANWGSYDGMVSKRGAIYIYSDHSSEIDEHGNVRYIPAIRIGDGLAYIRDLPFVSASDTSEILQRLNTLSSRVDNFWRVLNTKVSADIDFADNENLILYS